MAAINKGRPGKKDATQKKPRTDAWDDLKPVSKPLPKPPKWLLGVVAVAVAFGAYKGAPMLWRMFQGRITAVDLKTPSSARSAIFAGHPHLLFCSNEQHPEIQGVWAHTLVGTCQTLAGDLTCVKSPDCWSKEAADVLDMSKTKPTTPMVLLIANGNDPRQVFPGTLVDGEAVLTRHIKVNMAPAVGSIDSETKWAPECANRRSCVVLGYKQVVPGNFYQGLKESLPENRGVRVVSIDTKQWKLKLPNSVLDTRKKKSKGDILCLTTRDDKKVGAFYSGTDDSAELAAFVKKCGDGTSSDFVEVDEETMISKKIQIPTESKTEKRRAREQKAKEEEAATFVDGWSDLVADDTTMKDGEESQKVEDHHVTSDDEQDDGDEDEVEV